MSSTGTGLYDWFKSRARVDWEDVLVRDLRLDDIDRIVDYYYEKREPVPFAGYNRNVLPDESVFRGRYLDLVNGPHRAPVLAVDYRGKSIGIHLVNAIAEGQADFHAHFWDPLARGQGIAWVSGFKACEVFFDRFNLSRLLFKPPKNNPMSSSVAQKLPLRKLADTVLESPLLGAGTEASVYEVTRAEFFGK